MKTKIIVLGLRGIPDVQGGIERHCQELYPRLVQNHGYDVTVFRRKPYFRNIPANSADSYMGVTLVDINSPKNKYLEAAVHTFICIFHIVRRKPDIVHVHGIGPALMVRLIKATGQKVVLTHHGRDYERKKWNRFSKVILKLGERIGVIYSNKVIAIAQYIANAIETKFARADVAVIPNGISSLKFSGTRNYIDSLNLAPGKYVFSLGRIVPEKGFDYLIDAFLNDNRFDDFKLVIAGAADHASEYSEKVLASASSDKIVLTGNVQGENLSELFENARLFVLPSFYEGLPISALEAMSYGIDVLLSDIVAHREMKLKDDHYFKVGDVTELSEKLAGKLAQPIKNVAYDLDNYQWNVIAGQTAKVYESIIIDR